MRVVHVLAAFTSEEGMGRCVTEIAKRATSVDSIVITNKKGTVHEGVEVLEVGGGMELFQLTRRKAIRALLEDLRPDLVHLHGGIFAALLARSPAFKDQDLILSVYAWPSLPPLRDLRENGLKGLSSSAVLSLRVAASGILPPGAVRRALAEPRLKGIITQDTALRERLRPLASGDVRWIPHGAELDGTRVAYASSPTVVVSAGRAELSRGLDLLVLAVNDLLAEGLNLRLRLYVLPGREVHKIRSLARGLGIEEEVEIKEEAVADLRSELGTGTIAAFPFRYDFTTSPSPLTALEAMSVGLPIVGTDVACLAPILDHEVNGLVVPRGDRATLAGAVRRLMTDEPLWQKVSDGAIDTIRRWSWESSVRQVVETYEAAAKRELNA